MFKAPQKGFAAIYITLVVLAVMFGMGSSLFFTTFQEQARMQNDLMSSQAYVGAESGLEDALLRITEGMNAPAAYTFSVAETEAEVIIVEDLGGTRTITVEGDRLDRIRNIEGVYVLSGLGSVFFYGAQVGEGGLEMDDNSRVVGNVFSGGDIVGSSKPEITGSVLVAGIGSELEDVSIGGDAFVDKCEDANITGELHATVEDGCSYSSFVPLEDPVESVSLPIAQTTIDQWKADASVGGLIEGNVELSGDDTLSLGPVKINGDLLISNKARLTVTGVIWVAGKIIVQNLAEVHLSSSFGSSSSVIIGDGLITLENNSISAGSGQAGSYLMYLSTSSLNPALIIKNNAAVDIVYTSNGWIEVENLGVIHEVTGFGVHLKNNVEITYETGLGSAIFTSGPSAGWVVSSWKEVE